MGAYEDLTKPIELLARGRRKRALVSSSTTEWECPTCQIGLLLPMASMISHECTDCGERISGVKLLEMIHEGQLRLVET